MIYKIYVTVIVEFSKTGLVTPLQIVWENKDGSINRFEITQILLVERRASTRAGGTGYRYTVSIDTDDKSFERYLFYDTIERKWFVENKNAPDMGGPPY